MFSTPDIVTGTSAAPGAGRVLVVDDDPAVREVFGRLLRMAGFDVVLAAGGQEGLQVLRDDLTIRLVLLDLNMPDVNGWKFREIQRSDPRLAGIPTIILTGSALPQVVHEELLATGYLFKPVGKDELVSVVGRYCRRTPR